MKKRKERITALVKQNDGMELVQVAILVAIAIVIGLIFRTQIEKFVNEIFESLSSGNFK
ncbi:MAG: hypothetical protein LBU41_00075 [Clostridiales Family XIII bacterium]|nr:hypothetical protein [Clostridiales Family XIII bacterium]